MDVQVQVAGPITSKPTSTGGTKFDIPLSNGMKASTFDAALATKVSQFGSSVFTARIEQKLSKQGDRTFTNIVGAYGQGETLTQEIPPAGAPVVASQPFPAPGATPIVPAAQNGAGGFGAMSPEREAKIVKQSSFASASNLVGHVYSGCGPELLKEAEEHVDRLARKLFNAVLGVAPAVATTPASTVAQDAAAVASFVTEHAGQPLVAVGTDALTSPEPAVLPWTAA